MQEGWARWLPGLVTIRSYEARWLPRDLGAGLVLTAVLVPVGLAYAVASGLPGVCGLYATIIPLAAYALFGPSRILVLGPDSSLAAIILGVTAPLAARDANRAVALAGIMAIVSGAICILAGVARLGFITELLSKPVRYGYMNGIALTVLVSQAPKLIGVKIENAGPLREVWSIGVELIGARVNWAEFALGAASLATILSIRSFKGLPGVQFAIVGATAIVQILDLQTRAHVAALGPLQQGLPSFSIPLVSFEDLTVAALCGLAVALVSFADTSVLSRAYAARLGERVDPNQEMIGLGAANFAAGFFQGFPISSSSSRTPVAEAAGARTQLTGVVGAVAVSLLLLVAPRLLANLPGSALAAVAIASAIGLFEVAGLKRLYRIQRWEFWLSIVCLVGVAVFGAIPGIGFAVVLAVIEFLWDGWRRAFRRARQGGRRQRLSRHHPLSPCEPDAGLAAVPLGRSAVLRQRGVFQGTRSRRCGRFSHQGRVAGGRGRTGHQRRRHRRRFPRRTRRRSARQGNKTMLCRAQGPCEGQAEAVRTLRPDWRGVLFRDHRRWRRRVSGRAWRTLEDRSRGRLLA